MPDLAVARVIAPVAILAEVVAAGHLGRNVIARRNAVAAPVARGGPVIEGIGRNGGKRDT